MPALRLTAIAVEKLTPPPAGRVEIYDAEVPGLTLRVSASGVKSWSFTYRVKGDPRRLTLGCFPGVTLKLARERSRDARAAVQRGEDPVEDKKDEERERALNGFEACKKDFIEKYAKPKNKTWRETERILDRLAVPVWGDRPVKEIRRRDVVELVEDVASDTPHQANQLRLHLHKMFAWLMVREVVDANPVTGIPPPVDLQPRERVLSDAELVALWRSTVRLGFPFGPATRLLLLTGVRRNEAAFLRWDELDGDWAAMPGSRMKNGRDFRAPLSGATRAIVDAMPRLTYVKDGQVLKSPYVFTTNGRTPVSGWGKAKERLDKLMSEELREEVTAWRFHDLRRTMATGVAMLGYRREVIDRILAHVPQKSDVTSSVYNRFMYDGEAMEAVTNWAAYLAKLTTGLEVVKTA